MLKNFSVFRACKKYKNYLVTNKISKDEYLNVVCGIVRINRSVIVCQRKKYPFNGIWEFPGGKIEEGETKRDCLKRELFEELNIKIRIEKLFLDFKYHYPYLKVRLTCFLCRYVSGKIRLTEHQNFLCAKPEQILKLRFLDGNKKILNKLRNQKYIFNK